MESSDCVLQHQCITIELWTIIPVFREMPKHCGGEFNTSYRTSCAGVWDLKRSVDRDTCIYAYSFCCETPLAEINVTAQIHSKIQLMNYSSERLDISIISGAIPVPITVLAWTRRCLFGREIYLLHNSIQLN